MPRLQKHFPAVIAVLMCALLLGGSVRAEGGDSVPYLRTMEDVRAAAGRAAVPVFIQFDAKWCGYCRALQPHIQKLHSTMPRLEVYKVDMDASRKVAQEFGVEALPTMFIIYKGRVVSTKRGGMDEAQLFGWVEGVQRQVLGY